MELNKRLPELGLVDHTLRFGDYFLTIYKFDPNIQLLTGASLIELVSIRFITWMWFLGL
jgi:hypothetical protein